MTMESALPSSSWSKLSFSSPPKDPPSPVISKMALFASIMPSEIFEEYGAFKPPNFTRWEVIDESVVFTPEFKIICELALSCSSTLRVPLICISSPLRLAKYNFRPETFRFFSNVSDVNPLFVSIRFMFVPK